MPILDARGVVVLALRLLAGVAAAAGATPVRASNCLAVMPKYLLALEPAVILASARAAFDTVLLPSG